MNREASLSRLLDDHRERLLEFVRRHAGTPLLRFEAAEDLVQGVHLRALQAENGFEERSDGEFAAWVFRITRNFLADRRDYWFALKRSGNRLLRVTLSGSDGELTPLRLPDHGPGPATLALRREQLVLITRALAMLLPRDRDLVQWSNDGVPVEEQAERLGLQKPAVERARQRAHERLRKAVRLLE